MTNPTSRPYSFETFTSLRTVKSIASIGIACCLSLPVISSTTPYALAENSHIAAENASTDQIAQAGEWYYTQLTDQEKAIYDQMRTQAPSAFTNPADTGIIVQSGDSGVKLNRILFAFFNDHPEYFWVASYKLAWERLSDNTSVKLVLLRPDEGYFESGFTADNIAEARRQFDEKIKAIVDKAPTTLEEKLFYFTDWLARNNTYNVRGLGADNSSRIAFSGLMSDNDPERGPVCYGYATAMKVLLDRAGIPNAFAQGWAYNDRNMPHGEQHAWNLVQLEDGWYAIDPTWDDSGLPNGGARRVYFLVGSQSETSPNLKDKTRFGQNHELNAERTAAIRYHDMSMPPLKEEGKSVAGQPIEVFSPDGSKKSYTSLADAIAHAEENSTIRLWNAVTVEQPILIDRDITIDLNGQDQGFSRSAITSTGTIFDVSNATLTLINNGTSLASLSSTSTAPAIINNGEVVLHPNVQVKTRGSEAITSRRPQAAHDAYIPALYTDANRPQRTYQAWKVVLPLLDGQDDAAIPLVKDYSADSDKTILDVKNQLSDVKAIWKFFLPMTGNAVDLPENAKPTTPYEWKLVSHPSGDSPRLDSDPIEAGRYLFAAEAYGYSMLAAVDVTLPDREDLPSGTPSPSVSVSPSLVASPSESSSPSAPMETSEAPRPGTDDSTHPSPSVTSAPETDDDKDHREETELSPLPSPSLPSVSTSSSSEPSPSESASLTSPSTPTREDSSANSSSSPDESNSSSNPPSSISSSQLSPSEVENKTSALPSLEPSHSSSSESAQPSSSSTVLPSPSSSEIDLPISDTAPTIDRNSATIPSAHVSESHNATISPSSKESNSGQNHPDAKEHMRVESDSRTQRPSALPRTGSGFATISLVSTLGLLGAGMAVLRRRKEK